MEAAKDNPPIVAGAGVGAVLLGLFAIMQLVPWKFVHTIGTLLALMGAALVCVVWVRRGKQSSFVQKMVWLVWLWGAVEAAFWFFFASFTAVSTYFFLLATIGWYALVLQRLQRFARGQGTLYQVYKVLAVKAFAWDLVLGILATPHRGWSIPVLTRLGWPHPLGEFPVLLLAMCELYLLMAREVIKRKYTKNSNNSM